eukprot:6307956-Pyramimonas_sp.AAC.1
MTSQTSNLGRKLGLTNLKPASSTSDTTEPASCIVDAEVDSGVTRCSAHCAKTLAHGLSNRRVRGDNCRLLDSDRAAKIALDDHLQFTGALQEVINDRRSGPLARQR